jgi:hypothetical protein
MYTVYTCWYLFPLVLWETVFIQIFSHAYECIWLFTLYICIYRSGCKREELGQIIALSCANTDTDIQNTEIRSTDMDTDMNYSSNTLRILKNKLSFSNVDIKVFNDQIQVFICQRISICVDVYVNMHMYICLYIFLYDYINT